MDLNTAPPVEFDTALAAEYGEMASAIQKRTWAWSPVSHTVAKVLKKNYRDKPTTDEVDAAVAAARETFAAGDPGYDARDAWLAWYSAKELVEAYEKYQATVEVIREVAKRIRAFEDAFEARGGWTRAYLVTNTGGHVHKSMHCSTCFEPRFDRYGEFKPGTSYAWLPELSGHDEAEIITKAGSDACTVCYPNAPVNDLKRPRSIFSADERTAQQKRADAAAAKEARHQAKVAKALTADGSEFKVQYDEGGFVWNADHTARTWSDTGSPARQSFKTEQAGSQWAVDVLASERMGWGRKVSPGKRAAVDAVIEAIRVKHDMTAEQVAEHIEKKVAAKVKRDSR